MASLIVKNEEELFSAAEHILERMEEKGAHVLALQGDLGAGKTAFTKALARVLEIPEEVTSPTFVIMKSYSIPSHEKFRTLTHVDAYRIESEDELRVLDFASVLKDETQLVVIEWPERIPHFIPENAYTLAITIEEENYRRLTYAD